MDSRDHLTQLLDRKVLDNHLATEVAASLRGNLPFAFLMIDVDKFKAVNDTYGHPFGDRVLQSVATTISDIVGDKGSAYRYGGEEFLVLLPSHTTDAAITLAERVRKAVESSPVEDKGVTVSAGISNYPDHGTEAGQLIEMADKAMYDAKDRGRNLVRFAGEPAPSEVPPGGPERKLPQVGKLTESQKQEIRQEHFNGYRVRCPEDGAFLRVTLVPRVWDQKTQPISIYCPMCGLREFIK